MSGACVFSGNLLVVKFVKMILAIVSFMTLNVIHVFPCFLIIFHAFDMHSRNKRRWRKPHVSLLSEKPFLNEWRLCLFRLAQLLEESNPYTPWA